MKELPIEQKAQRYDKALEIARKINSGEGVAAPSGWTTCEVIFPELRESEDERIRKALLKTVKYYHPNESPYMLGISQEQIISWLEKQNSNVDNANKEYWRGYREGKQEILDKYAEIEKQGEPMEINPTEFETRLQYLIGKFEGLPKEELIGSLSFWLNVVQNDGTYKPAEKQGEQKPTDKPKFKVGDILVSDEEDRRHIYKVDAITNYDTYLLLDLEDGYTRNESVYTSDLAMYLWTIEDAKDGDVLFYRGNVKYSNGIKFDRILLFENLDKSFFVLTKYSNGVEDYGINENIDYPDNIIPATKGQKEILFTVMKEAGYEWDSKHKQLKKIEDKSAWDEESERIILAISQLLKDCESENGWNCVYSNDKEVFFADIENYLQSFKKNRIVPQPQQWSEEDEYYRNIILYILNNECVGKTDKENAINWLKSLKSHNEC